jgi:hypothetical protein
MDTEIPVFNFGSLLIESFYDENDEQFGIGSLG